MNSNHSPSAVMATAPNAASMASTAMNCSSSRVPRLCMAYDAASSTMPAHGCDGSSSSPSTVDTTVRKVTKRPPGAILLALPINPVRPHPMSEAAAPSDNSIVAQLATLRAQLEQVSQQVGRVESKVGEVVTLDKTMVALQSDYRHQTAQVAQQWTRIDQAHAAIGSVEEKADRFINTARGAYLMLLFFWTFFTGLTLAAGAWVFSSVQDTAKAVAVIQSRLERVEHQVGPSTQRP